MCAKFNVDGEVPQFVDYTSVGGALEAYTVVVLCVFVCVCNSVPPIVRLALKTKR